MAPGLYVVVVEAGFSDEKLENYQSGTHDGNFKDGSLRKAFRRTIAPSPELMRNLAVLMNVSRTVSSGSNSPFLPSLERLSKANTRSRASVAAAYLNRSSTSMSFHSFFFSPRD